MIPSRCVFDNLTFVVRCSLRVGFFGLLDVIPKCPWSDIIKTYANGWDEFASPIGS